MNISSSMAASASACCFTHDINPENRHLHESYDLADESAAVSSSSMADEQLSSFLRNLSALKNKVSEAQSMASAIFFHQQHSSLDLSSLSNFVQDISVIASSMWFQCQQMSLKPISVLKNGDGLCNGIEQGGNQPSATDAYNYWCGNTNTENTYNNNDNNNIMVEGKIEGDDQNRDIIEIDANELLARYTHYCQVCGKGFKREANLRMHMRAHGDEYKTHAALSNPTKNEDANAAVKKYYSCPEYGCRWNKNHAKFQPLKSMICAKNHYKRSHCPKMYMCKRCNVKQFAVLSDLKTHEKHCGRVKWQCSCGTTFSRKDKLMGHVSLFTGHFAMVPTNVSWGAG